ncbi:MAG: GntR family transcriptional regulator, partial [Nocardiopsaceae bacterium]|nr:GntR family transcriptional regulator [Nocardiopsaceae bacterium]
VASSPQARDTRTRPSVSLPAQAGPTPRPGPTARHRVRLALHQGIMSGTIPGGTHLVQSVVAEEFSASVRQVREALRDLAAEGFVRIDTRGGAVVTELSRSDLEDIYQIRLLLEPTAAARSAAGVSAAGVSEDFLIRAVRLLAAMESETSAGQWARLDAGFHRIIAEAGDSPRLAATLGNLRELSVRYVQHSILAAPERTRKSNAEHEEIVRAVLRKDPSAAADAMFRHLDGTLTALTVHRIRPAGRRPRAHKTGS